MNRWKKPEGNIFALSAELMRCPHFFIVGATGAGKTTLMNAFLHDLHSYSPEEVQTVLIDLKQLELEKWRTPHCIIYADTAGDAVKALRHCVETVRARAAECKRHGWAAWPGGQVYIIIDEYADLMIKARKEAEPLLCDLAIMGRSSGVHLCIGTQRPTRDILTGAVSVNIDTRICLRVATAQDSRNAISATGAELLPPHGIGYYRKGADLCKIEIPYYSDREIGERIAFWRKQKKLF